MRSPTRRRLAIVHVERVSARGNERVGDRRRLADRLPRAGACDLDEPVRWTDRPDQRSSITRTAAAQHDAARGNLQRASDVVGSRFEARPHHESHPRHAPRPRDLVDRVLDVRRVVACDRPDRASRTHGLAGSTPPPLYPACEKSMMRFPRESAAYRNRPSGPTVTHVDAACRARASTSGPTETRRPIPRRHDERMTSAIMR